jgi:hypothetical protein
LDFLYVPADDLLIVPLPDLILGLAAAFFLAGPALAVMYPLPERFTLPDALAALMPVARDLDFAPPLLLTYPLPDLILDVFLAVDFLYVPADDLLIVPLPDLILGLPFLDFDLPDLTFLVLVPLFTVTLTMI